MGRPAGVQIRRWFFVLVGLLIAVDGVLLGTSVVVERSVLRTAQTARPLGEVASRIRAEILAAQRDLFRYLAEFADDPGAALERVETLESLLDHAQNLPGADGFLEELQAIRNEVGRYRKVLELLPSTVKGARDWSRIQEYGGVAVRLGTEVERRAESLVRSASERIRESDTRAAALAVGARWTALGVLGVTVLIVLALARWWRRFQDTILGI